MVEESKGNESWNDAQLDAVVAAYFELLATAPDAPRGFKAQRKRDLDAVVKRGIGSIDFKLGNISFVAESLGLPRLPGFAPAPNVQAAIFPALDRYLSAHGDAWAIGDPDLLPHHKQAHMSGMAEASPAFSAPFHEKEPAPALAAMAFSDVPTLGSPRPAPLQRLIRKFDPAAKDAANRRLGLSGERRIYDHEIARLIAADRMDLAKRVEWTSQEHGDGAGYDIRSFDPASGDDRFIEIKSTKGGARTDFFLSRNERTFSEEEPDRFRLYRLYDVANDPKLFALKPPLGQAVHLSTETWRAGF